MIIEADKIWQCWLFAYYDIVVFVHKFFFYFMVTGRNCQKNLESFK